MKTKFLLLTGVWVLLFSAALADTEDMIPTFRYLSGEQQTLVRMIHQAAQEQRKKVELPKKTTYQDVTIAMNYLAAEYTDIPALASAWVTDYYADVPEIAIAIELNYTMPSEKEQELNARTQAIAREMLNMCSGDEIELAIHDILCRFVEYGFDDSGMEHNAAGAIVNGHAVCDGYAKAFALMCRKAGIPCSVVKGYSHGELHAWNLVAVSGGYAQVDVTWDDQSWGFHHSYYNLTDQQMEADHMLEISWELPACHVPQAEYCAACGTVIERQEQIVPALNKHIPEGKMELRFANRQLLEMFTENINYWLNMMESPFCGSYHYSINEEQMTVLL